jgi:DNA-binding IclR family transcriptional regulator
LFKALLNQVQLIPFAHSKNTERKRLLIDFEETHERDYSIDQEETMQGLG